jgi:alpha-tubulin suppressor-like RCC1 family protein
LALLYGVWCWGRNSEGELGTNSTSPPGASTLTEPVVTGGDFFGNAQVSGTLAATSIAAAIGVGQQGLTQLGGFHTCAVDPSGMAACWGWNGNEQVAPSSAGTFVGSFFPATIPLAIPFPWSDLTVPPPVLKVATGAYHSCVLQSVGIFCWGYNGNGELGNGSFNGTLGPVPGTAGALDLAAGGSHSCAVLPLAPVGLVACWGYNGYGEVTGSPGGSNFAAPFVLPAP